MSLIRYSSILFALQLYLVSSYAAPASTAPAQQTYNVIFTDKYCTDSKPLGKSFNKLLKDENLAEQAEVQIHESICQATIKTDEKTIKEIKKINNGETIKHYEEDSTMHTMN